MIKMLSTLLVIGGFCGALLMATHLATGEEIRLNREARARVLMGTMLNAPVPRDMAIDAPVFGACAHWIFQRIRVTGYAGDIELLALWKADNTMSLRTVGHRETPGIGDFIDHQRHDWLPKLDGGTPADFIRVDNVSGATITTNALREAARLAASGLEDYCNE